MARPGRQTFLGLFLTVLFFLSAGISFAADAVTDSKIISRRSTPANYLEKPPGFREKPLTYLSLPRGFRENPLGFLKLPHGFREKPLSYVDSPPVASTPPGFVEKDSHPLADKDPSKRIEVGKHPSANNDPMLRVTQEDNPRIKQTTAKT